VREEVAGTATAIGNMIIMVFGYVFHVIIGAVVSVFGGAQNSKALLFGISLIPVFLVLESLGFIYLFITEKSSVKTNYIEEGI
jgi:hypothetical protein